MIWYMTATIKGNTSQKIKMPIIANNFEDAREKFVSRILQEEANGYLQKIIEISNIKSDN